MNQPIDTTGITIQEANSYLVHLLQSARKVNDPNLSDWDKPAVLMIGAEYFPHLEVLFSELARLYALENRLRAQRSAAGGAKTKRKAQSARKAAQVRRIPDGQASQKTLYQRQRRARLKKQKKSAEG